MRFRAAAVCVVAYLCLVYPLLAQNGAQDMLNQRAREMQSLSSGPRETPKEDTLSRFRTDDDPTTKADEPERPAAPQAGKLMAKAERLSRKGRHAEAAALLREALTADPEYYDAANNLGIELEILGDRALAIETFQKLTKSSPNRILAFNNLARLLMEDHHFIEAEAAGRSALKLHPYSFKANLLLGQALVQSGKWTPEAKRDLEHASVKHPEAKVWLSRWP